MGSEIGGHMSRLQGYVRYPDKWIAATFALSDAAYRAYDMILSWMWLNSDDQCSIPDDAKTLAMATGMNGPKLDDAMAEIQNEHAPLLKREGERLVSGGLRKEAERAHSMRAQCRDAAHKRWIDNDASASVSQCERNADAMRTQCERNAHKAKTKTEYKREEVCAEPPADVRSAPPLMTFSCTGPEKTWSLTQPFLDSLSADFDTLNVLAECRKAHAWNEANPGRRKTARGMPRFLAGWMTRAVSRNASTPQVKQPDPVVEDLASNISAWPSPRNSAEADIIERARKLCRRFPGKTQAELMVMARAELREERQAQRARSREPTHPVSVGEVVERIGGEHE
jgi:uncharacterized protein YdaU (DUF1376 family)